MSYAVVLPVTDLDHVQKEIRQYAMTVECIRQMRRKANLYQNEIRKLRKGLKDEAAK